MWANILPRACVRSWAKRLCGWHRLALALGCSIGQKASRGRPLTCSNGCDAHPKSKRRGPPHAAANGDWLSADRWELKAACSRPPAGFQAHPCRRRTMGTVLSRSERATARDPWLPASCFTMRRPPRPFRFLLACLGCAHSIAKRGRQERYASRIRKAAATLVGVRTDTSQTTLP